MSETRLQRWFNLRAGEWQPVLLSALFFFLVLTALMVLRPARDALGMERGIDQVRVLFIGTAVVTLAVNPLFGWLVSRYARLHVLASTYGFFALSLIGFYLLLVAAPERVGQVSGQVFYVWFSVFNFFATMLFWALMADRYSLAQSQRLFPFIAAGGTLGAIAGPWLALQLAQPLGTASLLLVAVGCLLLALPVGRAVAHSQASAPQREAEAAAAPPESSVIGGSAWAGIAVLFRSPFLLGIAMYVVLLSVMVTFLYFTRLQMVEALGGDLDLRTTWLARIDLYTQLLTLVMQLALSGHLIRRVGLSAALALVPLTTALGFIGLAMAASLAALVVLEALLKALQRSLMRPARESLFTVVTREHKYKAKAVIDTFVYRFGDVLGAQTEGVLGRLGMGLYALTVAAVPLALLWAALGWWLGRTRQRVGRDAALGAKPSH